MNYGAFETDHIFKNFRESRLYVKKSRIDEIAGYLETTSVRMQCHLMYL